MSAHDRRVAARVARINKAAGRMALALRFNANGFLPVPLKGCTARQCNPHGTLSPVHCVFSQPDARLHVAPVNAGAIEVSGRNGYTHFMPWMEGNARCPHAFLRRVYDAYCEREIERMVFDVLARNGYGERAVAHLIIEYARNEYFTEVSVTQTRRRRTANSPLLCRRCWVSRRCPRAPEHDGTRVRVTSRSKRPFQHQHVGNSAPAERTVVASSACR
jgi:hypothetical protein